MANFDWIDRYLKPIANLMKNELKQTLIFLCTCLLATSIQGDWILFLVHFHKYRESTSENSSTFSNDHNYSLLFFICVSNIGTYLIYFSIGGFLQWYFYVCKRDISHEWKCQPDKIPSSELVRHSIITGSHALFGVNFITGVLAWYTINDGRFIQIYYRPNEFGWIWFILQIPIVFIYQDFLIYWMHRALHTPFLYKHIHKVHHKYTYPTPFTATAVHPIELIIHQITTLSPTFLWPNHWAAFYVYLIYIFYHAIIDHSGITFKAHWWQPWQPDVIFHDNHHQYFHVNYGFNLSIWDKFYDTFRRKDRVYSEDIYYGKGKALIEVTPEELAKDIAERKSENPAAYRSNFNENDLIVDDLKFK